MHNIKPGQLMLLLVVLAVGVPWLNGVGLIDWAMPVAMGGCLGVVALPKAYTYLKNQTSFLDGAPLWTFLLAPPLARQELIAMHQEEEENTIETTITEVPETEVPETEVPETEVPEQVEVEGTPQPSTTLTRKERASYGNPDSPTALHIAHNFHPDVDEVIGEGFVCFGSKGSGKTNVAALLLEEFARFHVPFVVFDIEGDYLSLARYVSRGRVLCSTEKPANSEERTILLTEEIAFQAGYDILEHGYQVVFDLRSWATDDERARIMIAVADGLMAWAEACPPEDRVPCVVLWDEAARWFPQDVKMSSLSADTLAGLQQAVIELATRGRKRGLTPCFFNQRISDLDKRMIAQANVYLLLKQRLDNDLTRYRQYVNDSTATKADIAAFGPGQGVVSLASGEQFVTRFYQRKSKHISHTPKASNAARRYSATSIPAVLPTTPIPESFHDTPTETLARVLVKRPSRSTGKYDRAVAAWNEGHNSIRKLKEALDISFNQARETVNQMKQLGLINNEE